MTGFSFSKAQHLRSKNDFERVYAQKCKAADGVLLLFAERNVLAMTRIGLSVSRKHGGAVVRNRLKRLLREAFRLSQEQIPVGFDLIAIPLCAEKASLAAYEQSIIRLSQRLSRRLDDRSRSAETST